MKEQAKIQIKRLNEALGIISSAKHPGGFWVINDSGNAPRIFYIDISGQTKSPAGTYLKGAKNIDWEDIASDRKGRIFIADTGNNHGRRKNLCVYVIREPDIYSKKRKY